LCAERKGACHASSNTACQLCDHRERVSLLDQKSLSLCRVVHFTRVAAHKRVEECTVVWSAVCKFIVTFVHAECREHT
jgi:hypothetical protein